MYLSICIVINFTYINRCKPLISYHQWRNYKILAHIVQYYFMAPNNRYINKIRQLHLYIYYILYNYTMYYNIYNS